MKSKLIILAILMTWPTWACAFEARVTRVTDGDTLTVIDRSDNQLKIRLYGIDAPEKKQRFGFEAKNFLRAMAYNQRVEVERVTIGPYGRHIAIVRLGKMSLNEHMLMAGYAWIDPRYCRQAICTQWLGIEREARKLKNGLWIQAEPQPPWEWRQNPRGRIKKSCDGSDSKVMFRGNTRTLNFHRPTCRYYDCKHCTMPFSSSVDAILAGYHPCAICTPDEEPQHHGPTINPFSPARHRALTDA